MRSLELKIPPAVVFLVCIVGMWTITRIFPQANFVLPFSKLIAIALVVFGAGIALSGLQSFRRHQTTVHPSKPEKASSLVNTGIFRLSRNPMYLGLASCLLAWGTYLENIGAVLGVPAFVLYLTQFQIKPEERELRKKFGAAYDDFATNVRRWL